jgi:hypothetical protein
MKNKNANANMIATKLKDTKLRKTPTDFRVASLAALSL